MSDAPLSDAQYRQAQITLVETGVAHIGILRDKLAWHDLGSIHAPANAQAFAAMLMLAPDGDGARKSMTAYPTEARAFLWFVERLDRSSIPEFVVIDRSSQAHCLIFSPLCMWFLGQLEREYGEGGTPSRPPSTTPRR